jgi:hypothetical protein
MIKKKTVFFLMVFFLILMKLYSQDMIDLLKKEYNELRRDLLFFGAYPILPYYSQSEFYRRYSGIVTIDVEDELTFSILGPGYVKYKKPDGTVYYSRFVKLQKKGNKYYRVDRVDDEFVDDIFETEQEGVYETIVYLPRESSTVERIDTYDIIMDNAEWILGELAAFSMNMSSVDPLYVLSRMLEIIYMLEQHDMQNDALYDFKKIILQRMVDIELRGSIEAGRAYISLRKEGKKVTSDIFWDIHDYYWQIQALSKFVNLEP